MTYGANARLGVKWGAFALIGGCAVCCAVPILTAVGLTGAAAASFWGVLACPEEWNFYALAGIAATGALIYLWQRRRACGRLGEVRNLVQRGSILLRFFRDLGQREGDGDMFAAAGSTQRTR